MATMSWYERTIQLRVPADDPVWWLFPRRLEGNELFFQLGTVRSLLRHSHILGDDLHFEGAANAVLVFTLELLEINGKSRPALGRETAAEPTVNDAADDAADPAASMLCYKAR